MEILHVARHNDPVDQITVSIKDWEIAPVAAAEIIYSLEVTDYYRSLSWL